MASISALGKWPRLAFAAFAAAVASVVAVLSIAPEQHLILPRVDDLKPIESSRAGSVCENVYSITKVHYDQICGAYQKMGEARIGSSGHSRVAVRMLVLPTFGRPASLRFELESSTKGTVTVRQLSRDVLRDDLLPFGNPDLWSSPFAQDIRTTFERMAELDGDQIGNVLTALDQANLWGAEFDPFRASWRYHFRGLLGDSLSSTLLQLVGLGTVIECFDGVTWVIEALADQWGAVMRICRPIGEGQGTPPLPLDGLGNAMIQIGTHEFPDLDLLARADRSSLAQ
jgi:hypothetical protein